MGKGKVNKKKELKGELKLGENKTVIDTVKPNPFPTDILFYSGIGIVLILSAIIRYNFISIPFERDEGSYAYCGRILLDGAKTFRDIGSQRLDGVFYIYALLVAIFGYSLEKLHIAFLVVNMLSTLMIMLLVAKLFNKLSAIMCGVIFIFLSMTPFASGFTIQSEHLVAFFAIAGLYALIYYTDTKSRYWIVVSGLLFSITFQIKQTSVFYGFFAGCFLLFYDIVVNKKTVAKGIINAFLYSGSVLILIGVDLLIIWINGTWDDFMLWFFEIREQYTSLITLDQGLPYLKMTMGMVYAPNKLIWIFSILGTFSIYFTSIPLWKKIFVSCLNLVGFLTIVPGYHFYGHYFLQWMPALSINAVSFLFTIQNLISSRFKREMIALFATSGVFIYVFSSNLSENKDYYFNPDYNTVLKNSYGFNPFPESKIIADKLNTVLKPEDKIAVLGTEIQMYVYTNKISPSRFAGSGALVEFPVSQANEWQNEFISDVESANPRFLIFFDHPFSWMSHPKVENLIFPWFNKFIEVNYQLYGYADMQQFKSVYVWEKEIDLVKNPIVGPYKIYVFERKTNS